MNIARRLEKAIQIPRRVHNFTGYGLNVRVRASRFDVRRERELACFVCFDVRCIHIVAIAYHGPVNTSSEKYKKMKIVLKQRLCQDCPK